MCLKVRTIILNEGEGKLTLNMFEKTYNHITFYLLKILCKHINAYVCRYVLNYVKPFGLATLSPRVIDYLVKKEKKFQFQACGPEESNRFPKQYKLLLKPLHLSKKLKKCYFWWIFRTLHTRGSSWIWPLSFLAED